MILALKKTARRLFQRVVMSELTQAVMSEPALTSKYYPDRSGQPAHILLPQHEGVDDRADFPVPPKRLWICGEATSDEYLSGGLKQVTTMLQSLHECGFSLRPGFRVLDFGCASGRMIRWLRDHSATSELWGVDIQQQHIWWCQQHLNPPFNFATTTTCPHLPFEDNHFQLIYCGSVFSHITDLADTWLLELRRVLAPGGMLYATVNDNHSIELLLGLPADHRMCWLREWLLASGQAPSLQPGQFSFFTIKRDPITSLAVYDRRYLEKAWGRLLKIRAIVPEVYDVQSAVVMEKYRPSAPN